MPSPFSSGVDACSAVVFLARAPLAAAQAASRCPPSGSVCAKSDAAPDDGIAACTAIIDSGTERGQNLAIAHFNRANGWLAKGEFDRAVADLSAAIGLDRSNAKAFLNRGNAWGSARRAGPRDRGLRRGDPARPGFFAAHGSRGMRISSQRRLRPRHRRFRQRDPARTEAMRARWRRAARVARQGRVRSRARRLRPRPRDRAEQSRARATSAARRCMRPVSSSARIADFAEAIRLDPSLSPPTTTAASRSWRAATSMPRSRTSTKRFGSTRPMSAPSSTAAPRCLLKGDHDRALADLRGGLRIAPEHGGGAGAGAAMSFSGAAISTAPSPTTTGRSRSRPTIPSPIRTARAPGAPRATSRARSPISTPRSASRRPTPPPTTAAPGPISLPGATPKR